MSACSFPFAFAFWLQEIVNLFCRQYSFSKQRRNSYVVSSREYLLDMTGNFIERRFCDLLRKAVETNTAVTNLSFANLSSVLSYNERFI